MLTVNPVGRRLLVALPVMFSTNGDVDLAASKTVASMVANSRADGAFICGTTGEFLALTPSERLNIFQASAETLGEKRAIAHVGTGDTRGSIELLESAAGVGLREFAAITPYYLPASEDGVFRYYRDLAAHLPQGGRLYAYHFEDRTTTKLSPAGVARIAGIPGIVGVKMSGKALDEVLTYKAAVPAEFDVYTGNDADFPVLDSTGLTGVVSGVASVFPEVFDSVQSAKDEGDKDAIARAASAMLDCVAGLQGDMVRMKYALHRRGLGLSPVRLQIDEAPEQIKRELDRLVDEYVG